MADKPDEVKSTEYPKSLYAGGDRNAAHVIVNDEDPGTDRSLVVHSSAFGAQPVIRDRARNHSLDCRFLAVMRRRAQVPGRSARRPRTSRTDGRDRRSVRRWRAR